MKILTNIRFAQTAGIAQVLLSFLDFVKNDSKNNIEIVGVNIQDKDKDIFRKSKNKKIEIISVSTKIPNIRDVVYNAKTIKQVEKDYEKIIQIYQRAIREEKPDLVLVNGTYFMPWCLFIASERENVPAVLHYHGILTKETQTWKKEQKKIFMKMEKYFDKKSLFYIFPSKIAKDVVEKEVFGHKIKKFCILPNPVSSYFFSGKNQNNKKHIGIVSRWANIKNVEFCEKLAKYNNKNGKKFTINIITDLSKDHKKYKELSKIVKFHDPKSNKGLVSFYKKMGVIISPSHFETYGNVAKESIASGTPAIVGKNMGVAETFEKLGLQDWVIDFQSVEKVYRKIEEVIDKEVHSNIIKKLEEKYLPEKIFNQMMLVLAEAV